DGDADRLLHRPEGVRKSATLGRGRVFRGCRVDRPGRKETPRRERTFRVTSLFLPRPGLRRAFYRGRTAEGWRGVPCERILPVRSAGERRSRGRSVPLRRGGPVPALIPFPWNSHLARLEPIGGLHESSERGIVEALDRGSLEPAPIRDD